MKKAPVGAVRLCADGFNLLVLERFFVEHVNKQLGFVLNSVLIREIASRLVVAIATGNVVVFINKYIEIALHGVNLSTWLLELIIF